MRAQSHAGRAPIVLEWTREGLTQHMRTLVAAGLFASDEEARRECMLRPKLLMSHKLRWYVERKAAVLEAGGSMDDVLAACCLTQSLEAALPCLLLWRLSECAAWTCFQLVRDLVLALQVQRRFGICLTHEQAPDPRT